MNKPVTDRERKFRVRIKPGTVVGHDFSYFRWPKCKDVVLDPDMKFEATLKGFSLQCVAPGFGVVGSNQYGNGAIWISIGRGLATNPDSEKP